MHDDATENVMPASSKSFVAWFHQADAAAIVHSTLNEPPRDQAESERNRVGSVKVERNVETRQGARRKKGRLGAGDAADAAVVRCASSTRMKNKRVLVVDDEHAIADFVHTVITLEGGVTVLAATAEQALACLSDDGPFDLMVLDLALPDRSGWELLASARDLLADCKIVIFSAQVPDDAVERARTAGVAVALSLVKPVAATALRDALLSVLEPAPGP